MERPPSVSVISCPHGSTVGIKCANAIILSISSTFSSSLSECCFFESSCKICSTKCCAEGTGSDADFAVSIVGDVDFFGSCLAMGFFGVSGLLCASLRVPFAVTGLFFVKAALAVAYLRTGREGVCVKHALTLDDEAIPWRLETPPKYDQEMLMAMIQRITKRIGGSFAGFLQKEIKMLARVWHRQLATRLERQSKFVLQPPTHLLPIFSF